MNQPIKKIWDARVAPENTHQNLLLASLSKDVQERLFSRMEWVELPQGKVVYESGDTVRHVYFPTDAIIALLCVTESGASAETALVGNEGVAGLALLMGGGSMSTQAVVQNSGHAYRLPGQRFMDECDRHGELLQLVLRYTQTLITQMSQTAVCNRHHCIEQRLCCWLLLSLDRLPGTELAMTQELIASMLGVRREGVTEAAGKLQRQGIIEYYRGRITVLDRTRLEHLSCECYAVVRKETDRLLPGRPAQLNAVTYRRVGASAG
ncbi:MAG TPA: Crp/Fnr family transcriptional regulator [Pseudomonas sp.]|nr:Crp/Fnr family transcriptional regulator [Pseudomonas sp.]